MLLCILFIKLFRQGLAEHEGLRIVIGFPLQVNEFVAYIRIILIEEIFLQCLSTEYIFLRVNDCMQPSKSAVLVQVRPDDFIRYMHAELLLLHIAALLDVLCLLCDLFRAQGRLVCDKRLRSILIHEQKLHIDFGELRSLVDKLRERLMQTVSADDCLQCLACIDQG